jgi:hypothetical protein
MTGTPVHQYTESTCAPHLIQRPDDLLEQDKAHQGRLAVEEPKGPGASSSAQGKASGTMSGTMSWKRNGNEIVVSQWKSNCDIDMQYTITCVALFLGDLGAASAQGMYANGMRNSIPRLACQCFGWTIAQEEL